MASLEHSASAALGAAIGDVITGRVADVKMITASLTIFTYLDEDGKTGWGVIPADQTTIASHQLSCLGMEITKGWMRSMLGRR